MTQTVDPWSKRRHSLGIPVHRHCHDHGRRNRSAGSPRRRQTCMDGDAVQLPE